MKGKSNLKIENKSKKQLNYLAEVDSYLLEINELRGNLGTAIESKNIALKSQEQATEKQAEKVAEKQSKMAAKKAAVKAVEKAAENSTEKATENFITEKGPKGKEKKRSKTDQSERLHRSHVTEAGNNGTLGM